ncbi:2-dehydro-3-deoxygluconokinase [Candidatus Poribacteria bacterium]|nr:2-dehydro-3-deoxygluconokinase [Candidatus Poribacteria bacterium]|tara:strand:- start:14 stop:1057 length:1044 start_codon:yes stop_codon:yes gene_type:complete
MYDLVTFGEAMVRLASPDFMRLENASTLLATAGGAELNVAVNSANIGLKTAWVSRLVDNWSGRFIRNKARESGVDTSHIIWSDFDGVGHERNGFYHLELGAGPRASSVTYDRGYTAISNIQPGELDWTSIFDGAKWFHLSGITPALSETAAAVSKEALEIARKLGLETSYDLNFRSKLWSPEEAQAVNQDLVKFVTVLIGNEEDFEKSLGFKAEGTTEDFAELDPESYKEVVFRVADTYPNVKKIGTTLRDAKTGWLNDWRTLLFDGQQFYLSQIYKDLELVDRVGGGDSFSSGLIYSLLREKSAQEAVDFAGAYSALAHTFPGDFNWATVEEAEKAMQSGSVRISR